MEPQDLQNEFTFIRTFRNESSMWEKYGQSALAMFVMQFYLHLDNVESFASDAITDGGNDKKIDLCHIDLDEGRAIIGQCYLSPNWGKEAANANKASDINTGISWLLSANIDRVPELLKPKAQELRDGLSSGEINRIEVLFIHNHYSSGNVAEELEAAANAAYDLSSLITTAAGLEAPTVSYREFGLQEIQYLYQSIDSDIMINDWLTVPVDSWILEEGHTWKAVVASVPASWIRELRLQHGDDLVSANFRNYLGIRKRKDNINHQIRQTVIAEPENFWVFNNGVTALTHELNITEDGVNIRGISIINGAQTSGAIGESDEDKASDATVLFRVVACEREALINKIILYNNT